MTTTTTTTTTTTAAAHRTAQGIRLGSTLQIIRARNAQAVKVNAVQAKIARLAARV